NPVTRQNKSESGTAAYPSPSIPRASPTPMNAIRRFFRSRAILVNSIHHFHDRDRVEQDNEADQHQRQCDGAAAPGALDLSFLFRGHDKAPCPRMSRSATKAANRAKR